MVITFRFQLKQLTLAECDYETEVNARDPETWLINWLFIHDPRHRQVSQTPTPSHSLRVRVRLRVHRHEPANFAQIAEVNQEEVKQALRMNIKEARTECWGACR